MAEVGEGSKKLARYLAAAWLLWAIVLTIAIGGFEPFVIIFAGVPILGWWLTTWKPNRITFTVFGVMGLLVVLLNLPFIVEDLAHPESAFGFNISVWPLLTAFLMILVGVSAWRPISARSTSRALVVALSLFGVGLVVSVFAALQLEDDASEPGDVALFAEKAEWGAEDLAVTSPGAVFVENKDPVRHTFAVEALGIEVELPAGTARRVEITASSGSYEFICSVPGHESMKGTLIVE